jgi:peptidoglycan/xylan/chitin deacetylase (PgdA/CDA1 family)
MLKNTPHRILIYHGIDQLGRKDFNLRFISDKQLEAQLIFLKNHYTIVPLDVFFERTKVNFKENKPEKDTQIGFEDKPFLAITFDDGYLNNFNIAYKLLEKYQIPATFFITGIRSIGKNNHWSDALDICVRYNWLPLRFRGVWFFKLGRDYRSLSNVRLKRLLTNAQPEEIRTVLNSFQYKFDEIVAKKPEIAPYWQLMDVNDIKKVADSPLIQIGVHGLNHYNLAALPLAEAEKELLETKVFLEKTTGKTINAVAWPFGLYSQEIANFAMKIGLNCQYAVDFLFPDDVKNPNMRERMGVHPFLEVDKLMKAVKKGSYR